MLLHFDNQVGAVFTLDFQCSINRRHVVTFAFEGDIDNRPDDLRDISKFICHSFTSIISIIFYPLKVQPVNHDEHHYKEIYQVQR